MTSNVGAQRIIEPKRLGFDTASDAAKDYEHMKSGVMEEVKRLFKPEFINRIDEIMVFHPLNEKEMMEIVTLLSKNLSKRCKEQLGIDLVMSTPVKQFLVKKYADAKMGARPLKRAIQSVIEDAMAEELLKGNIKRDSKVTIGLKDEKITFTQKDAKVPAKKAAATGKKAATVKKTTTARKTSKKVKK